MPRKKKEKIEGIEDKLEYLGLELDNIPKKLKEFEPLEFRVSRFYDEKQYRQYRYIPIQDLQILLSPTNRLEELGEKYKKASPLYEYLDNEKEENILKYTTFLNMLKNFNIEDVENVENEQNNLNREIPFKIKYQGNYLWQIYYSENTDKYFMIVPTEDTDYSTFFYILKKKIENKKNAKIFVPVSNVKYSNKFWTKSAFEDMENYLWMFTKDWPLIYEVYDKNEELSIQIIGETNVYGKIKTPYKIELKTAKEANEFYKLIKALFILQTELPHYFNFTTNIDENCSLEFYLEDQKIQYKYMTSFIRDQYKVALKSRKEIRSKIRFYKKKLEELDKAIQKAYQKNKNKFNVPGFRKGKVPYAMIEKMYGAGVFYEEAANDLIPEAYANAAAESELEIVARPEISVTQIEKGKPFVFEAEVTLKPEVKLGEYKGIKVEKADTKVTAKEVNAELDKIKEQNARLVAADDKAIEEGDQATIDFEGFVDGVAFEGGKGEDYPLTIGSHSFIDTFEDQLVGKKVGEEVEVNVTFPEEYQAKELAGKPAMFKVTIKEIKVKEYPKVDDEFAQEVSEFDTLAEYKADIKKDLVAKKKEAAAAEKESKVIEEIVKNSEMDIPEKMIEAQAQQMVEEFAQNIAMQGISFDQYMQFTGSTVEQLLEQVKPQAKARIESSLVLEEVVKAEKIEATDEEFEKELEDMASRYQMEKEKVAELLSDDDKKNLRNDICLKKAAKFVTSKAK